MYVCKMNPEGAAQEEKKNKTSSQSHWQIKQRLEHLYVKPTIPLVTSSSSRDFFRLFNRFYPFLLDI